eukprot:5468102-Pyramimonas_sp.AAC.1
MVFPSWLEHSVPPHQGKRPRITISFNIAAYWLAGASRAAVEAYPRAWAEGRSATSGRRVDRSRHDLWPSVVSRGH